MPAEMDLVKANTLIRYVREIKKMRISASGIDDLCARNNQILKDILTEAVVTAKKENKPTVMPRHLEAAAEKAFGKRQFTPQELFEEIKKATPIELGEICKLITTFTDGKK
jgi:histone H3/H4